MRSLCLLFVSCVVASSAPAAPHDAAPQDAGPGPQDAAPQDAGPKDAAPQDAGPQDAAAPAASPPSESPAPVPQPRPSLSSPSSADDARAMEIDGSAPASAAAPIAADASPVASAPLSSPAPAAVAPSPGPQLEGPRDGRPDCRPGAAACLNNEHFALWPRVRLRAGYEFVQPDSQVLTVGQSDGFYLDQNRIGFDGVYKDDVRFRLIIDVVNLLPSRSPNDPVQPITAAVRDAWVAWMPSDWFYLSVGQQFVPGDIEGTTTISALPFTRRSAATSGVRPGHGFAVDGLSPPRQTSVVIGSTERARLGSVVLHYMFGLGNGNGQNVLGNDNKLPAAYARLGAGYVDGAGTDIRVGVGGRYNPRTVGTLPNLFQETDTVGFADVDVRVQGFQVTAQVIYKDVAFGALVPDFAGESGLGATAWLTMDRPLGLDLYGLRPAYRISYFDPSSSFADDQLLENTLAVRWDVPALGLPLALIVDGTLLTELGEGVRDLDNARLSALLQLDL
jgi:hypothetical protein